MLRWIALVPVMPFFFTAACSPSDAADHASSIPSSEIVSRLKDQIGLEFIIQKTYTGGATGDTLFKAWSCRSGNTDCRLQAIIDTHDGPPPQLAIRDNEVDLVVNKSDAVWDFSSVSIDGKQGRTAVRLKYL